MDTTAPSIMSSLPSSTTPRNAYIPALHGTMPPRITCSSLGILSVLPVPVVNKILSLVLRTTSPVRIKAPRHHHLQYVSIIPPHDGDDYKSLVLVSRKVKKGAMWNYLATNISNGTEVVLVWGGEPIPPVLRITDFTKYLQHVKTPLTIKFDLKIFPTINIFWGADPFEVHVARTSRTSMELQAKFTGEGGLMEVAWVGELEMAYWSRREFMEMVEVLGGCQGERFDVYFLWRVIREAERAVKRWSGGELL